MVSFNYLNSLSDSIGWRFILNLQGTERLLCLERSLGTTASSLSRLCQELYVVHYDICVLHVIQQNLNRQGISNVACWQIPQEDIWLPFPDEYFDGFIFATDTRQHLFETQPNAPKISSVLLLLLGEVYRVLKKDGFAYINLRSTFSYDRFATAFQKKNRFQGSHFSSDRISLGKCKRTAIDLGFVHVNTYKLLGDDEVREVILGTRYHSVKNSFLLKERIKQVILSDPLGEIFSPLLGIFFVKGSAKPNWLQCLIHDLVLNSSLLELHPSAITLRQYQILPGKVILSIGEAQKRYGERIIVVPLNPSVLQRLRDEAAILDDMGRTRLHAASLIPRFYLEGSLFGQPYFVQQEMPGTSIDAPVSSLDTITLNAFDILAGFHLETVREVIIDDDIFQMLFSNPLHRLVVKLGPVSALLASDIEQYLRAKLLGNQIKTVWMHGDFKIENLMINPKNLQVTGVIDWDLSQREGLPFLDLLYLIVYNRVIRKEGSVEEIVLNCILPRKFSEFEKQLCEKYLLALDLQSEIVVTLTLMFWIYHIAYRIQTRSWGDEAMQRALHLFDKTAKILKAELA